MKHRPRYLDIRRIRLPLPGFVSILHRASGFLLFLAIPVMLFFLQESLSSGQGFANLQNLLSTFPVKAILIFLLWAFLHHFCAGIRLLLLDMGIGLSLQSARASSRAVMLAGLFFTIFMGAWLW
ncbi:MAG: succinate dehydrogenase, cytochrome b556 subunit [Burkholderiales bacterium]